VRRIWIFDLTYRGIEASDGPDWTQPGKHKSPTRRPGSEILNMREDVGCIVAFICSDRQGDDRGEYQDKVHENEDRLHLSHDARHCRGNDAVTSYCPNKNSIDDTVAGRPVAVSGDHDHTQKHQRETVIDGTKAAHKSKRVAVADKEAQRIPPLGRSIVVGPIVKP